MTKIDAVASVTATGVHMMRKTKHLGWKSLSSAALAVTLLAGSQSAGAQVSAASQTLITNALGSATGVAIDPLGNLYIADGANGVLNTSQGSNAAPASLLNGLTAPGQVAVDASRNVYIANGTSSQVVEIPYQSGALNVNATIQLGKGLGTVTGVAVDLSGNVYIVDAGNKQAVKISGTTQTTIATGLTAPKQIAVDRLGNVYIADAGANKVVYLPLGGAAASTVGTGLNAPAGVATDAANNVYIADTSNGRVLEVPSVAGAPSTTVQNVLTTSITSPVSLALDSRGGLYIASASSVYRYTAGSIYFGLLPSGTASQTFPVTLNFTAALTPATIKVVTTGVTGLDYKDAGGSTCAAGTSYAVGASCVVNVSFTPAGVGPRYGAIVLYDASNKVLARIFLGGGGLGPLLTIDPGTLTAPAPTVATSPAFLTPRGLTTDAAGNIFIAEYTNSRILEIPASQVGLAAPAATVIANQANNSVSINGAGDLLVGSGSTSIVVIPFENGTWNSADLITVGTGYSKARTVKTDVGGNLFWCDNGNNSVYEAQIGGTPVKLPFTSSSASCLGIAVDLYGNIATTDSTNSKVLYVPVSGAAPYETGTGLAGGWGITFDASGSVWVSSNSVKELVRIPNENGVLTGSDQILSSVGASLDFDIWMDNASGTLYTTQSATTVLSFSIINREQSTLSFSATGKSSAIGTTSTALDAILSNSGNMPPIYTNGGMLDLYDINDFPSTTFTPAPAAPCNFSISLAVGFTCYVAFDFSPQSSGARAATVDFTSNAPTAALNLTGTSSTAVGGTITLKLAQIIPASGSPEPGQSVTMTATATTSTATAATGPLTFYVDGVAQGSVALASNTAAFTFPAGLTVGTHTLGVTYAGDKNYQPITTVQTLSITVVAAPSSVSLVVPSVDVAVNQTITFTASVPTASGLKTPTGKVTFSTGNTTLGSGTLNASGVVSINYAFTTAGSYPVIATYAGDGVYAGSASSAVTVTVGTYTATNTALAVTPSQPAGGYIFGTPLNATVTVVPQSGTGTPGGAVDIYLDGAPISTGTALGSNGSVSITLSSIGAGAHSLVAFYSGSATYATSSSAASSFTVVRASTATTLSISSTANFASVPVTLTATVSNVNVPSAVPSGTVVFFVGKASLGSAVITIANGVGTATLTTPLLPGGTDSITAVYQGDTNDLTSTSTAMTDVVTLVPSTLTLVAAPSVILSGGTSVLTATVSSSPVTGNYAGSVTFYSGTTALGAPVNVSSGGIASFTTAALTAPTTTYSATYSGSSVYTSSATTAVTTVYVTNAGGSGVIATASLGSGLSSTAGTAVDISGNLYITDATKGLVALVAGGAGGQTTVLSGLAAPSGLAVDGAGDLFVANGAAGQVTKILSQNNSLVASSAKQLGTGLGALSGVGVDVAGNVYAADATNKQLVKIAAAGGQTVLNTTLINPQQVAVDSLGNIYVADGTGNRVVYISVGGTAGTVGSGLVNPTGVAVDNYNNVYISDTGNNRVVKVPFVGTAPSTAAQITLIPTIAAPGQLAADRHQALYIGQGKSIYKWEADAASFGVITPGLTSPTYTLTYTFATAITPAAINVLTNGAAAGAFKSVAGGTCTAGTAYTAGQTCTINVSFSPVNAGITAGAVTFASATGQPLITAYLGGVLYAPAVNFDTFTNTGTKLTVGSGTVGGVTNGTIRGIAADSLGNVYVCDNTNGRIVQTNTTGSTATVLLTGTGCGSVALDGAGNLIVDDMGNNRMLLLPNENGTINGNDAFVVATGFNGPRGMTLDGFGDIVVADTTNARTVLAPIGGATTAQIAITNSLVTTPYDAAIDWQGNLAVIDTTSAKLVYLPASGAPATTVGPTFCSPYALAMDGGGAVFVAETGTVSATNCVGAVTGGVDVVRVVPGSNFYDVAQGHTNPAEGISLDTQGNLYLAYNQQFEYINRSNATPLMTFGGTAVGSTTIASTDLGGASTATTAVITNGGPAPLTLTSAQGTFFVDSGDFALTTPGTPTWLINPTACNFTAPLAGGAACTIGLVFSPVQAGLRTADYSPAGNEVNQPLLQLAGNATSTTTTTATTITLTQKTPTGVPFPYTPVSLATTLAGGSGTFGGTVTLAIDGVFIGQQAAGASLTFADAAGLSPGFHTAVAIYSGDANNSPSTVNLFLSAAGATPAVSMLGISPTTVAVLTPYNAASSSVPNALPYSSYTPVTLQASITGSAGGATPTGIVEFFDGTTLLGTAKLNAAGVASLVYSGGFTQGTHNITADYAGDATYSTAISTPQVLTAIYPGDYTLTLSPSAVTIVDGNTASITITAASVANLPSGTYNGQIGLTCSGLPNYATCSFSPNTIYLDGTGNPVVGVLTIVTQAGFARNVTSSSSSPIRLCLIPGASLLLLLGVGGMRRRGLLRSVALRNLVYILALGGLLSPALACGSHAALAPAAGNYTVTISGSGTGGINHSVTMQVTLKQ